MQKKSVSIGLMNPKSPDNVGSVIRAAANYRIKHIFYTGERYLRAINCNTGSVNTSRKVGKDIQSTSVENILDAVAEGMKIVCIELVENAIPLPEYQHPEKAFYIFGPEDGSISQAVIDKADAVVYIPTVGCMNLAATVNVVLYDRLAKTEQHFASNDLVRQSKDRNNNLKLGS